MTALQEFELSLRHVAALPAPAVPAYTTADLRYGWRFRPAWTAAGIGRNLLGRSHAEFGAAAGRSEIPRSLLIQVAWQQ